MNQCPKVPCAKEAGHSGLCGIRAPGEAPPSPLDLEAAEGVIWDLISELHHLEQGDEEAAADAVKAAAEKVLGLRAALPLGEPGKGMEETGIIRKALESALAGVWDGHYSGTGVTVEYAQAVDAEVKEAIKILDGDPSASRPLRDAKREEELGELAWEPHARALRDVMEREGIEVVCLGPRWEAKFHDLHEPEGKDSE
jgi:hypothetical protein